MRAPLFPLGAFGDSTSLWVALGIGIAFGFLLERAGFGSARKLVAQFYLDDLAVFKVMFTAIVTAMVGLYALGAIGFLDPSLLYLTPTNPLPQLVGGLVLGFGFVVGGYCPGTSVVGMATGRLDAAVFLGGVAAGTYLMGELTPFIQGFCDAGDLGRLTLPELLRLPQGVVVGLVLVVAVGGFVGAQRIERRFAPGGARSRS
jgi:uncharacterized membrane protein YedE/YeeE